METVIYSLYLSKLEQLQRFERRMTTPPFSVMLVIAFSLHIVAMLVIGYFAPKNTAIPVAVRQLTLQLGNGKDIASKIDEHQMSERMAAAVQSLTKPSATPEPKEKIETPTITKSSLTKDITAPKKRKNTMPSTRVVASAPKTIKIDRVLEQQEKKASLANSTEQTSNANNANTGSSSVMEKIRTQEMMLRYEQKLSGWINQYKVYPEDAFKRGIGGNVVLRIRIDRSGYIKFILIQESSGYDVLDQAVIDAAKKANPVPLVPTDYPGGQLLEFLIPVKFALK
jgi:protein TonB